MSTGTGASLGVKCPLLLPNFNINGNESTNIKSPNIKFYQNSFSVSHVMSVVFKDTAILIGAPEGYECT
jgi:hypothetical protein